MKYLSLLLFSLFLLQGCNLFRGGDEPEPEHLRRTVLVYWAAQNSLGASRYSQKDSAELAQGMKHLREGERLLLFIDDQQHPRLYEMARGFEKPRPVLRWKQPLNSADANTLREVLQWVRTHYVSDEYGLVLASHATGWVPSMKSVSQSATASSLPAAAPVKRRQTYGLDVGEGGNMARDAAALGAFPDEMAIDDLATALRESGMHPRYILFDCCLMQNIEVLYALRHSTDYIIASPIAISAEGGPYTQLIQKGLFSQEITDIGHCYVEHYQQLFQTDPDAFGIVLSIVRTDKVADIAEALAQVLPSPTINAQGERQFWDMSQTQKYAAFARANFYRPHYYDLNDALRQALPPADHARVKAAIDAAVVYKGATSAFYSPGHYGEVNLRPAAKWGSGYNYEAVDLDHYCGISIFVPQAIYSHYASSSKLGDLNEHFRKTSWYKAAGWQAADW